ncbi:flagellar export protein FliJ [Methylobacterium durans]|jgi:flagellar export protein FliJ|uniref:Flagellar FliJ protein n=1 Tax=Methylobacterium durans TaxID=2202825 RepID=A0A2U8W6H1_9HYPH|nr:flagellar export protein FliJ [Methylobacterium durans]AWN41704.1 flagellar export protein FliJ [Methylobacterium durans]MEA1832194.1 flagellar export protein FliJ [Methylobacterium durans]
MKSRDTLIRLRRFQVDEKRRRVTQIEMMMADFLRMAAELDREVAQEEGRAGITDPAHFAYPTYARAAAGRRDNMRQSAAALEGQLDEAKAELGEAFEDLKKVEILEDRERSAERAAEALRDQAAMDGIGLSRARA